MSGTRATNVLALSGETHAKVKSITDAARSSTIMTIQQDGYLATTGHPGTSAATPATKTRTGTTWNAKTSGT